MASGVAVTASLLKNAAVRKSAQSTIEITRPDGSTIKLEAEKTSEDDVKKIMEQIVKLFPARAEAAKSEPKQRVNNNNI